MKQIDISKIAVIGAGQIGPDILFHFAKSFAEKKVQLVLVDIAESALQNAQKKIEKKIARGLEAQLISPELAVALKNCIHYTSNYSSIANSEIVLEAATESEPIKDKIFQQASSGIYFRPVKFQLRSPSSKDPHQPLPYCLCEDCRGV